MLKSLSNLCIQYSLLQIKGAEILHLLLLWMKGADDVPPLLYCIRLGNRTTDRETFWSYFYIITDPTEP